MTPSIIDTLVQLRGIESDFVDAYGRPTTVHPGTKEKLLSVYDITKDAEPMKSTGLGGTL